MAEPVTKILTIDIDANSAIDGIVRLNDAIDANNRQMKLNNDAIKANNRAMKESGADTMALTQENEQLRKVNIELASQTKELANERRVLQKETQNEIRMKSQEEGSLRALRAELSNLMKQYDSLSRTQRNNEEVGGQMQQQILELTKEIKDAEEGTKRFQRNVGNYAIAGQSMRSEIRQMTEEIAALTMQYNNMSDAEKKEAAGRELQTKILELTEQASIYKDTVSDIQQSIARGASDTRFFDALAESGKMLAASFGLASSAAKALGLSEDSLQQSMLKVQQAMQAVQALTVLQNATQKQSIVMKGIAILQSKAAAQATKIEAAATASATGATKAQTIAQAAFNLVAKANPYVLLATAILAVIGLIVGYTAATKDATKADEEAKKAAEARKNSVESMAQSYGDTAGEMLGKLDLLREGWNELGDDMDAKRKFIEANQGELDKLSVAVNGAGSKVRDFLQVEKIINDTTGKVEEAIKRRAMAMAAYAEYIRLTQMEMQELEKIQGDVKWRSFKTGDKITQSEYDRLLKGGMFTGAVKANTTQRYDNMTDTSQDVITGYTIVDAAAATTAAMNNARKAAADASKTVTELYDNLRKIPWQRAKDMGAFDKAYIGAGAGASTSTSTPKTTSKGTGTAKGETEEQKKQREAQEAWNKKMEDLVKQAEALRKKSLQESAKESIDGITAYYEYEKQEFIKKYGTYNEIALKGTAEQLEAYKAGLKDIEKEKNEAIDAFNKEQANKEQERMAQMREDAQKLAETMIAGQEDGSQKAHEWKMWLLQLQYQEELAEIDANERLLTENKEMWEAQRLAITEKYAKQKEEMMRDYAQKEWEAQKTTLTAMSESLGSLSEMFGAFGEENKSMLVIQKTLALAQVMMAQAVAIANAVKAGSNAVTPWQMIAQIAASVAAVTTAMMSAFKSLNSAKFATGGYIRGAGTGTSDSIPVRVSNGESIMNANTTSMFSGLLSSLNQLGGGVPIQATQTAASVKGEDMLARAVAKGVAMLPAPVVSVEDINRGQRQVQVMNERATL